MVAGKVTDDLLCSGDNAFQYCFVNFKSLARKYPYGLRQVGEMWLYTNRGIGLVAPPVRFLCRPEITLLRLVL